MATNGVLQALTGRFSVLLGITDFSRSWLENRAFLLKANLHPLKEMETQAVPGLQPPA